MPAVTKEQIDTLVKVQQIEIEAAILKAYLKDVPARIHSLEQQLEEYIHSVENDEAAIEELNKQYRALESDVQLNLGKIQKSQEKLRSVKTNKEYQSSLKEIDDIEAVNSRLEDEMLAILEKIDTAETALKNRKQHYNEIVDESNEERASIKREAEQREAKLGQLESSRVAVVAEVDAGLIDIFNRVKAKQANEVAIVAVKDAVCQGCNMNIPPQVYNELQRCDSLRYCPSCFRIIYWQNQDERSE
jgi:predicted  nucleic acid-binding Zn-ribbon protein